MAIAMACTTTSLQRMCASGRRERAAAVCAHPRHGAVPKAGRQLGCGLDLTVCACGDRRFQVVVIRVDNVPLASAKSVNSTFVQVDNRIRR